MTKTKSPFEGFSYHASLGLVVSGGHVPALNGAEAVDHQEIFYTKDGDQFHRFQTDLPGKFYQYTKRSAFMLALIFR